MQTTGTAGGYDIGSMSIVGVEIKRKIASRVGAITPSLPERPRRHGTKRPEHCAAADGEPAKLPVGHHKLQIAAFKCSDDLRYEPAGDAVYKGAMTSLKEYPGSFILIILSKSTGNFSRIGVECTLVVLFCMVT